jgi:hypothetical protein
VGYRPGGAQEDPTPRQTTDGFASSSPSPRLPITIPRPLLSAEVFERVRAGNSPMSRSR